MITRIFPDFDYLTDNPVTRYFTEKSNLIPSVNIYEFEAGFRIEVAAPGLEKADFKIDIDKDILTISSEKVTTEPEGEKAIRKEFETKPFKRTFTIPETVDTKKISATYNNGILIVNVPKREAEKPKPTRNITIE